MKWGKKEMKTTEEKNKNKFHNSRLKFTQLMFTLKEN